MHVCLRMCVTEHKCSRLRSCFVTKLHDYEPREAQTARCGDSPPTVATDLGPALHRADGGCWGPRRPAGGPVRRCQPALAVRPEGAAAWVPGSTAPGRSVYVGDSLGDIEGLLEVCTVEEAGSTGCCVPLVCLLMLLFIRRVET